MNRREFLRNGATLTVAVAGLALVPQLWQGHRAMAEASTPTDAETWLLTTGQQEVAPDLYELVTQQLALKHEVFMPLITR